MYGSPFPKLNPRVPYKTALERAGFDVNRAVSPSDSQEPGYKDQRSISASVRSAKGGMNMQHGVRHDQRLNSMPVKMNHGKSRVINNSVPLKQDIVQPQPVPAMQVTAAPSIRSQERGSDRDIHGSYPAHSTNPQGYPQSSMMDGNSNNNNPEYLQNTMVSDYNISNNENSSNAYTMKDSAQLDDVSYHSHNESTFNFENPGNQYQHARPLEEEEELNPIEKSFNILTQNDTQSEISGFSKQNDTNNIDNHYPNRYSKQSGGSNVPSNPSDGYSKKSYDFNSISNASNRSSKQTDGFNAAGSISNRFSRQGEDFNTSDLEDIQVKSTNLHPDDETSESGILFDRDSRIKSLNFAPNDNLHVSMHPDDETIPLAWNNDNDSSHIHESNSIHTQNNAEIKPQTIEVPTIHTSHHEEEEIDIQSPVSESNTNMHVEQLIAQLDDVSFSRNEQSSPERSLAVPNDKRLKKSSAYLSGFPKDHPAIVKPLLNTNSIYDPNFNPYNHPPDIDSPTPPPLPQNTYQNEDDNESVVSQHRPLEDDSARSSLNIDTSLIDSNPNSTVGATPTFYKFNQDMNESFYSSSTSLLLPKDGQPSISTLRGRPGANQTSPSKERIPGIKFPPGQGPCRTCGLDITGKGVFSKNLDELSGQWHKKCFKCSMCDIRFNKSTPCYILNDMPYCQQHYHEKNNSICKICEQFIEGECLENDKKERFHVNCLTCFLCHEPITQDYFIFNDKIPLCANHDMDALIADGLMLPNDDDCDDNSNESHLSAKENTVRKRRTRLINFQDTEI